MIGYHQSIPMVHGQDNHQRCMVFHTHHILKVKSAKNCKIYSEWTAIWLRQEREKKRVNCVPHAQT